MKNSKNILKFVPIIALLSGCSCQKKQSAPAEAEETLAENSTLVDIIDPFIDSELVEEVQLPDPQPSLHQINNNTPNTNKGAKETPVNSIPYEKYDTDSYTNLDITEYDSGLKYQILREGPAGSETPKRGETLVTHYICWHDNNGKPGQVVDNTYERGEPFEFKIGYGYVIRGWDDALMDMRVGDKRRLYIPSEMAFGQAGATELVPGDTNLIYEVEIMEIK